MRTPRIQVTAGHPTDRELAAIVTVLTSHSTSTVSAIGPGPSAWIRAARLEGRGHPPIDDPARLRASFA